MTIEKLYHQSIQYLTGKKIPTPDVDARAVIAHHLNINRNELFLHKEKKIGVLKACQIKRSIRRRGSFKPVAYILGNKYFYKDRFLVSRKTLIPRADTEHILYAAEETGRKYTSIIDIGTGTGALAVSLSRLYPDSEITALDLDINPAKKNIQKLHIQNIKLVRADFARFSQSDKNKKYDLIVSNPPYLSDSDMGNLGLDARIYEPRRAFYGGRDGLDFYHLIARFAEKSLMPGGIVIVETDHKWQKVEEIFRNAGFGKCTLKKDYNGLERVLVIGR